MKPMIEYIARQFNDGGPFMWAILIVLACAIAISLERIVYYFVTCRTNSSLLVARIAKALNNNNIPEAKQKIGKRSSPLFVLIKTAIEQYELGLNIDEISEGIEQKAIKQLPRISQRLNYLSLFANIATLLGLLGTITGLQVAFGSLASVEASKKATMLAVGISQAMNTTAFGLIVAIPCMVLYTMLVNKQQEIIKDLDEAIVKLLSYLRKKNTNNLQDV